jgi:hypothetical protein
MVNHGKYKTKKLTEPEYNTSVTHRSCETEITPQASSQFGDFFGLGFTLTYFGIQIYTDCFIHFYFSS